MLFFFFFKQKTAYEIKECDWSSDVCSSDLDSLVRREQVEHAGVFVRGLLSDLEHKNAESIAYRFGQQRMPLQWFIGVSPWDDADRKSVV